jgi:FAD/FMN-containing dehydrogenase
VKTDGEQLQAHAVDGRVPWAVLFPGDTQEVSRCVKLAAREGLALIPWGSGTKVSMGNPPARLDVVLSTARMDSIVDIDTANLTVTAQAGVRWRDLQDALASEENRCYLPLSDPSTTSHHEVCSERQHKGCFVPIMPFHDERATVGGVLAANSIGPTALLYGLPRDVVLGTRFVGREGRIVGMGGKTVKNVSGYDICKLMIGSLGTLGILCEMTLRLLPLPERSVTFMGGFPTLGAALDLPDRILKTLLLPAAVDVLNTTALDGVSPPGLFAGDLFAVVVMVEGFQEAVQRMLSEMTHMARAAGATESHLFENEAHRVFWHRYSNMTAELQQSSPRMVSLRMNFPVGRHHEAIDAARSVATDQGLPHALAAQVGCGIARIHVLPDPADDSPEKLSAPIHDVVQRIQPLGGNVVVERAPWELKAHMPVWGAPRADAFLMKRIKAQLDPGGLFSPGRFLDGI